ncbi:zinc finger, CCHC-type containing protein [Tanacetum coccineum]
MMTGTKFDVEKFNGKNDFRLWQVRMKALLEQQGLAATLEELPATTIVAYDNVIQKKAYSVLILYLGKSHFEHINEFHKLVGDLAAIDTAISDEDHALLLLISLPLSYDNFVETLLYGRDTLKLEDGEIWSNRYSAGYNHNKSQGFARNENEVSGSGADGYGNADVMMAMNVEELLDWIIDSGGSYHITYKRDYLADFEEYDSDNILLGDGRECRVWGTGKVQVQMKDGSTFVLNNIRYVPELRQNLISLGTLEKKDFTVKRQFGKIKVIKGSLVILSGTRRANCVYTLNGQAVTRKTLKGKKQLGEYQTRWKIKTGNVLNFCNKRSTQQCTKSRVTKHLGVAVIQQHNGLVKETNVTLLAKVRCFLIQSGLSKDLMDYHSTRDMEQNSTRELFEYREDSNEAAFAVAAVDKIYAHESLTFNITISCKVISKWKARLKDDMDARSDVYVLSNGSRKCSDDSDSYYLEDTQGKGKCTWYGDRQDQSGNTLRVSQSKFYSKKLVQTLLEGHSILSLEGSLSGDYDVEKNGKWSCIYVVGSQEYQMVCTGLDIASEDVGMLDKFDPGLQTNVHVFVDFDYSMGRSITVMAGYMTLTEAAKEAIWLKRLAIESGFELKIVAGIATGALSKVIPGLRFQHSLKALEESFSNKNYVKKFLRALHPKWRAKVTAIKELKDLSSLSLDELIGNLKVHEMILEKYSELVRGKREKIKSFALKAKKESSDGETSTSESEDEALWHALDLKHLIGECPKPPRNNNQKAFVGGKMRALEQKTLDLDVKFKKLKAQGFYGVTYPQELLRALPCQLPPKELNPGSFTLPYTIGSLNLYAMADLGASVNIMPRLIFEHLNLVNLKKTDMLVEMADMTRKAPVGIVENVLVKINKFLFPFDFMIMDTIGETNETMILGRPFLATIHSQMDAFKREISLGIGEDRILFDMDGNVCHSNIPVEKVCMTNSIQNEEPFNPLEINIVDSSDHMQGPEVKHKEDHERQSVGGSRMTFANFLKVRDFSYEEWLEIKLGHTNVSKSVRNAILNEWVLDSFDVEIDYGKTRDDPYSRRFDEYKEVFDNEIEQLGNEYDLRIGKKGYALDDVWEKCKIFHGGTVYPWHDEGFEEEERWKSGIEKTDYEQPFADIETFEIKRCSFKEGRSFVCITK